MTALGKLFRTTTFKLTLAYLVVFSLFAAFLLGYFALNTGRLITEQINDTVDAEITGLAEQYRQGGIRRLVLIVDGRSRRPGSSLYLVTTYNGDVLAGNVGNLPEGVLDGEGWRETPFHRQDDADSGPPHRALVRVFQLPGGFRLLVGRDLEERHRVQQIVAAAARWSIALVIILGIAGGVFVTRRVLRRIDAMTETTKRIMDGDLSGRLPVAGSNDELDRLAGNLNAMLERIEALMRGMKEVSDNIAHDLKTPLTRMRNRAEEALRAAHDDKAYRDALESTIEESDGLIRTFNALLMIARAEAGNAGDHAASFDAAEIVRGVGELYEPVAEEKGLRLVIESGGPLPMVGNRELVTQALANLVDNAIKYGKANGVASHQPGDAPADADTDGGNANSDGGFVDGAAVNGSELAGVAAGKTSADILVRAAERDGRILLSVADHGPGIPVADRGRVTDRFVRLESSRSLPGSGLGLSLVAAVARLHGGDLTFEDNAPGLKSTIALPRGEPLHKAG